ncbi:serum amyloid A-2 protein isoform X1 [Nomascus leucogenys]|nr:serum amyloid A-2 protein isoform X1 [Nomascus leucogenys]
MKLLTGLVFCSLVLGVSSQSFFSFLGEAFDGARDMWRAYSDMKEANYIGADKYFHARGNYDAAKRGPGGAWAAEVISLFSAELQRMKEEAFFLHSYMTQALIQAMKIQCNQPPLTRPWPLDPVLRGMDELPQHVDGDRREVRRLSVGVSIL